MRMLDLGAGAGRVRQMNFRGRTAQVCGLDPDPRVLANPHLDEARVGTGEAIPYEDESFDVIFADNVLEHLADPPAVLREVARALRPGGTFLAKTPNRRHYVPLIARATPHWFHAFVNRRRGRCESETFPTLYRANTPGAIRRLAAAADLTVREVVLAEGRPEYLRSCAPTYLAGAAYERLVNSTPLLAPLRVILIAVMQKPASAESRPGRAAA
jgi:SAM-dependent methyltransferase